MTGSKRLFLVGNGDKEGISDLAETFTRMVMPRSDAVLVGSDFTCMRDLSGLEADLVIALGGDGTILGAARRMGRNQLPTLGINAGHLGFLSSFPDGDMPRALDMALAGQLAVEQRQMIRAAIHKPGGNGPRWTGLGLNDGVLGRPRDRGLMTVDLHVGGAFVSSYAGDGVVVSTAGGSTAYCLSGGGPILAPDMESLVVVPLACHSLSMRPLVVHGDPGIRLGIGRESKCGSGAFVLDGQVSQELLPGEWVEIRPAGFKFNLLTDPRVSFFQLLRKKLGWAGQPNYRK